MERFTFQVTVDKQTVNNIMSSALKGMSYWADDVKLKETTSEEIELSEAISRGHTLLIHESEENVWHEFDINNFLEGLSKQTNLDFYEYDMYDSENVVQAGLFGKLKYA